MQVKEKIVPMIEAIVINRIILALSSLLIGNLCFFLLFEHEDISLITRVIA
jgi:hypothetical protein